jgi:serine protease Do
MGRQMGELVNWARQRKLLATFLLMLTLGVGIILGSLMSGRVSAMREQGGPATLAIPNPVQLSSTFASIAKQIDPAVVNIATTQVVERQKAPQQRRRSGSDDQFRDFFDRFFQSPDDGPSAERSLGSGVVVDEKGYILTNNHVVEQATRIQVKLHGDPTQYTARVIGTDPDTDLAVIKIDSNKKLTPVRLGNSEGVQVGDWVLAVGSPFGLEATVTAGIVSAKDRSNIGNKQFQRFIQTDAAINPGNSGGPLVNMAGEVIGINTAIFTMSRGYEGVGFALPSNTAINVYNQLVTSGKVTRGSIGIVFQEDRSSNPVLLKELGVEGGIVVERVEPGSPAAKAGLKAGDVITAVNGQAVKSGSDLVNPITITPIGSNVRLAYVRDRKAGELTVAVADRAKLFPQAAKNEDDQSGEAGPVDFGVRVEDITPDLQHRLGLESAHGIIVVEVQPASFSEDVGFSRGDVVLEINREAVSSVSDWRRVTSKLKPGQNVLFKVLRGGGEGRGLTVFLAGVVPNPQ